MREQHRGPASREKAKGQNRPARRPAMANGKEWRGTGKGPVRTRDVYFFLHIPKCAGRTVQHFLVSNFGDKDIRSEERDRPERYLGRRILFPARRKAPWRFIGKRYENLESIAPDEIDFVIGFYVSKSIAARFAGRTVKEAVLIRDPVGHFFSHYNFRMQKYENEGLNPFGFDIWYRSRRPNPISKYILSYLEVPFVKQIVLPDQAKLDLILDALSQFWHVGLHEECGELIARIAKEQGAGPGFETRNVTYKQFMDYEDYKKTYAAKVVDENRIDQAIFEFFSSKEPAEKRERPKIRGREFRNMLKGVLVPYYVLRYRLTRRFNI